MYYYVTMLASEGTSAVLSISIGNKFEVNNIHQIRSCKDRCQRPYITVMNKL